MQILLAEGGAVALGLVKKWLTNWGHNVLTARDGEEAWQLYRDNDIPMIIADWSLPKCNALDLCKRIRLAFKNRYTYVIVVGAKADKRALVEALESGADDFISKPLDMDVLRVRLRAGVRIVQLEVTLSERLTEVFKANEQMRENLEAAAAVQHALLPSEGLEIEGLNWACAYEPCEHVAGDIMNIFRLDENTIGFYVLDVSGHGVPAAMFAVSLSRILTPDLDRSTILKQATDAPPYYEITPMPQVMDHLNRRFPIDLKTYQYFTIIYGTFDLRDRIFRYGQAGHPGPAVMIPGEEPKDMGPGDSPIGFIPEMVYQEREIQLPPGSRLYLYSDGVVEASSPDGDLYGFDRFKCCLEDAREMDLKKSLEHVRKNLRNWSAPRDFNDDVTLLAFEVQPD